MSRGRAPSVVVRSEQVIGAPADRVFETVADVDTWDSWLDMHRGWPDGSPAPLTQGQVYRQQVCILGGTDIVTWTVEALQEARIVLFGRGTMGGSVRLTFAVDPNVQASTFISELEGFGPRGIDPLVPRGLKSRFGSAMQVELDYQGRRLDAVVMGRDPASEGVPTLEQLLGKGAKFAPLLGVGARLMPGMSRIRGDVEQELTRRSNAR